MNSVNLASNPATIPTKNNDKNQFYIKLMTSYYFFDAAALWKNMIYVKTKNKGAGQFRYDLDWIHVELINCFRF